MSGLRALPVVVLTCCACLVVAGCGGGGASPAAKKSTAEQPIKLPVFDRPSIGGANPIVPPGSVADAETVLTGLDSDHYRLLVQNTSAIGYITQFSWTPPHGMKLVSVVSSSTGRCSVSTGLLICNAKLRPSACSCRPGGGVTVEFRAVTGSSGASRHVYGLPVGLFITAMTPVIYPVCDIGQKSSEAHKCI